MATDVGEVGITKKERCREICGTEDLRAATGQSLNSGGQQSTGPQEMRAAGLDEAGDRGRDDLKVGW